MSKTRKRPLLTKVSSGRVYGWRRRRSDGLFQVLTDVKAKTDFPHGSQVTVSENHPAWRSRNRSKRADIGGDFSSTKTYCTWGNSGGYAEVDRSDLTWVEKWIYTGPITSVVGAGLQFPPAISSNNIALDAWGAKAVASAKPTNALVDLSTTLGEMIGPGGIPAMIGRAAFWHEGIKDALKTSASDFLNVQFSLTPLVQDMVGFAHVVDRFNALVKQYERDAGKVVRRRWNFEPIKTEVNSQHLALSSGRPSGMFPGSTVFDVGSTRRVLLSRKTEVRRWFSGAFTYHLPTGYSSRNKLMSFGPEAQRMLGLQPTPETLWNLAPWSWAIDWFSSAGDVVSNISDWSNDGLVMRYGYLMEHSVSSDTYFWTGTWKGTPPSPVTLTRESKVRRKANPFGFGLTWNGLSPRQVAIAAALGISRGLQ